MRPTAEELRKMGFSCEHERELAAKDAEIERLRAALKPFAVLADRKEYTLDDVPHGLFINAKLALRGLTVVNGLVQRAPEQSAAASTPTVEK